MSETEPPDRYTHGHHASVVAQHKRRTADADAAYLLPHLRPGMRVLDVGCGPGTITQGLAAAVAPGGEAVGMDAVPEIVDEAAKHAAPGGAARLRFQTGDVYALPFEAGSFDVVHAHQLLQHLTRPVEALREMRRVAKRGGLIAVRDADYGSMIPWPSTPALEKFFNVYMAVAARNGAEARAGRFLRAWCLEAGLPDLEFSGTAVVMTEPDEVRNWGYSWAERTVHSNVGRHALEYGIASRAELAEIAAAWRSWADEPAAFFTFTHVEVLASVRA
ncbi:MAG: methyltransferase domain-containing protein [Dehalococcoidia bacterium]